MTFIKLLQRADSKENWERINPVLSEKEVVYEVDKSIYNSGAIKYDATRCKIGDGVTPYSTLPYIGLTYDDVANRFARKSDVKTVGGWELNSWEDIRVGIDESTQMGIYVATEDSTNGFEYALLDVDVFDSNNISVVVNRTDGLYLLRKSAGFWLEPVKIASNQMECRIFGAVPVSISGGYPKMITIRGLVERKSEPLSLKKVDCIVRLEATSFEAIGAYQGLRLSMDGTTLKIYVNDADMGTANAGATLIIETLNI